VHSDPFRVYRVNTATTREREFVRRLNLYDLYIDLHAPREIRHVRDASCIRNRGWRALRNSAGRFRAGRRGASRRHGFHLHLKSVVPKKPQLVAGFITSRWRSYIDTVKYLNQIEQRAAASEKVKRGRSGPDEAPTSASSVTLLPGNDGRGPMAVVGVIGNRRKRSLREKGEKKRKEISRNGGHLRSARSSLALFPSSSFHQPSPPPPPSLCPPVPPSRVRSE